MTTNTVLSCQNLSKSFVAPSGANLAVLRNINFSLAKGETCAVLGPSGSGKTTLLAVLAGLETATAGDVLFDGVSLSSLDQNERAKLRTQSIGFVFQNFHLVPTLTALENTMLPLEIRYGSSSAEIREQAAQILSRFGLGDRIAHYPAKLSGGEQQRVALARAFIAEPKVLFADEPTGSLDGQNARHALDLLLALNTEHQTAVLLVTHDQALADTLPRQVHLHDGVLSE